MFIAKKIKKIVDLLKGLGETFHFVIIATKSKRLLISSKELVKKGRKTMS